MEKPDSIYANNKCADQPVHSRSLISTFVTRLPDPFATPKSSSIYVIPDAEQTGLCQYLVREPARQVFP